MQPLPSGYLDSINTLSQMPQKTIIRSVGTLLERDTNVGLYNRYLYDSISLLQNSWRRDENWDFTSIKSLTLQPKKFKLPSELIKKITAQLDKSKKSTFTDFAELQTNMVQFTNSEKFLNWFNKYIPYLVVGLDASDASDYQIAKKRLQWFLMQDPDHQKKSQLKEGLQSYGLRYLMAWQDLQSHL